MTTPPLCVACGRPVVREESRYDVFEQRHWTCFHFDFEHGVSGASEDPDIACGDPNCPARAHDPNPRPTWLDESDPAGRQ